MTETGSKVFSYDGVSLKESNISEILFLFVRTESAITKI